MILASSSVTDRWWRHNKVSRHRWHTTHNTSRQDSLRGWLIMHCPSTRGNWQVSVWFLLEIKAKRFRLAPMTSWMERTSEGGKREVCLLSVHELELHIVGFSWWLDSTSPSLTFFFPFMNLVPLLSDGSSCEIQVLSLHIVFLSFLAGSNVQISLPQGRLVGGMKDGVGWGSCRMYCPSGSHG